MAVTLRMRLPGHEGGVQCLENAIVHRRVKGTRSLPLVGELYEVMILDDGDAWSEHTRARTMRTTLVSPNSLRLCTRTL